MPCTVFGWWLLLRERSVNVKEQEQRIGLLGEIVDAVVLLLAAAGLRGNAFQLPRTFHLVTLLSQWLETVNMEVSGASGSLATLVAALQFIVELPLKHWCSVCGLTPHCYVENVRAFLSEVHTLLVGYSLRVCFLGLFCFSCFLLLHGGIADVGLHFGGIAASYCPGCVRF